MSSPNFQVVIGQGRIIGIRPMSIIGVRWSIDLSWDSSKWSLAFHHIGARVRCWFTQPAKLPPLKEPSMWTIWYILNNFVGKLHLPNLWHLLKWWKNIEILIVPNIEIPNHSKHWNTHHSKYWNTHHSNIRTTAWHHKAPRSNAIVLYRPHGKGLSGCHWLYVCEVEWTNRGFIRIPE